MGAQERGREPLPAVTRRILTLACLHLAAAVALGVPASWNGGEPVTLATFVGFTAAFALVGLFPVHVELGRHACAVTLLEAVLVLALFEMGPLAVVAAATVGEWLAGLTQRKSRLKVLFNTAATLGAVMVAAQAFALGGVTDPSQPASWGVTLLAVAAYAAANHASTSAVLMLAEGRRFDEVFTASATAAALATMVSASVGLAAVVLHAVEPLAPLLLTPLFLAVVASTRRITAHRAEHLRFERLYEATSRTAGLQELSRVLATVAEESRGLITGAVGFCCAPDRHGAWHGVLVDDHGSRPVHPRVVAAVRRLVAERGACELAAAELPDVLRLELPPLRAGVVATTPAESLPAVLAVFREIEADDRASARAEVLAAFAGHAALTVSNACLYEEAGEALRHQLDLNRRKDDFVAVVSHELRTPLTSMLGAVATLRRIGDRMGAEDRFRLLAIAERQGHRLRRLIEDLLAVAAAEDQEQPGPFEQVDLCALLDELDGDLALGSGGRLRASVKGGVRWVRTDGLKLRQLLTNLVENAIKYAPGSPVEVRASAEGGTLVLTVADHGPGIAEADRERVFERFVQLDQSSTRANGGTGLGLYLCRQLARLLGGPLTVDETPGGGATFTLSLPGALAAPSEDAAPAVASC